MLKGDFKYIETDLDVLTIGLWQKVSTTGDLTLLISDRPGFDKKFNASKLKMLLFGKKYKAEKEVAAGDYLIQAYDYIDTLIFNKRGPSQELKNKTHLKARINVLTYEAVCLGDMRKMNLANALEAKLNNYTEVKFDIYEQFASLTEHYKIQMDPMKTSINQFFGLYDSALAKQKKNNG